MPKSAGISPRKSHMVDIADRTTAIGVAQGVGWSLHESYVYNEGGRITNSSLLDYRMPIALDLPRINIELIEVPASDGPYGVRGVDEVPIVPPAGTLANWQTPFTTR